MDMFDNALPVTVRNFEVHGAKRSFVAHCAQPYILSKAINTDCAFVAPFLKLLVDMYHEYESIRARGMRPELWDSIAAIRCTSSLGLTYMKCERRLSFVGSNGCSLVQCLAISSLVAIHTPSCPWIYSINFLNAGNRPGLPMMRECSPIDIIFGAPLRPSSSRRSNADLQ